MEQPLSKSYLSLWEKYSTKAATPPPKETRASSLMETEEGVIVASLRIKEAMAKKAEEANLPAADLLAAFIFGVNDLDLLENKKNLPKVQLGLAKVNLFIRTAVAQEDSPFDIKDESPLEIDFVAAMQDAERFKLNFDFDSPEELFLLDKEDAKSVFIVE